MSSPVMVFRFSAMHLSLALVNKGLRKKSLASYPGPRQHGDLGMGMGLSMTQQNLTHNGGL